MLVLISQSKLVTNQMESGGDEVMESGGDEVMESVGEGRESTKLTGMIQDVLDGSIVCFIMIFYHVRIKVSILTPSLGSCLFCGFSSDLLVVNVWLVYVSTKNNNNGCDVYVTFGLLWHTVYYWSKLISWKWIGRNCDLQVELQIMCLHSWCVWCLFGMMGFPWWWVWYSGLSGKGNEWWFWLAGIWDYDSLSFVSWWLLQLVLIFWSQKRCRMSIGIQRDCGGEVCPNSLEIQGILVGLVSTVFGSLVT